MCARWPRGHVHTQASHRASAGHVASCKATWQLGQSHVTAGQGHIGGGAGACRCEAAARQSRVASGGVGGVSLRVSCACQRRRRRRRARAKTQRGGQMVQVQRCGPSRCGPLTAPMRPRACARPGGHAWRSTRHTRRPRGRGSGGGGSSP
eukprot:4518353-Prymnesium_polylepis.1